MNARQARFVDEYLVDLNATQAAIRAGYSERTAKSQGQRLLTNVDIQAAVEAAQSARSERTEITQDWVLESLQEVAERCMQRVPVMRFDREEKRMVQDRDGETGEGVWQFDASGANRSLELIGKHLGMFKERHEHTGPNGGPIKMETQFSDAPDAEVFGARDRAATKAFGVG